MKFSTSKYSDIDRGFKIRTGQWTMSGQNGGLTRKNVTLPVMLTGHAYIFHFLRNCNVLNKLLFLVLNCHNLIISFS